ncbi:MAG: MoaD/ThiS family protein, partial [Planctomycetaceae bacterium]|nr:MoaD/ThiS family protein [Planctomycetaceae bacterium]
LECDGSKMPTAWIPSLLRELTGGQESVAVAGTTVAEVIADLDRQFPGIKQRLCEGDALRPGIAVAIDTQLANLGLLQHVPETSEVHFLPAISGGQANRSDISPR